MKLSEDVLVEIIDIVRQGIAEGKDISELLRKMELGVEPDSELGPDDKIFLEKNRAY